MLDETTPADTAAQTAAEVPAPAPEASAEGTPAAAEKPAKKAAARKTAAKKTTAKKAPAKRAAKKVAAPVEEAPAAEAVLDLGVEAVAPAEKKPAKKAPAKRTRKTAAQKAAEAAATEQAALVGVADAPEEAPAGTPTEAPADEAPAKPAKKAAAKKAPAKKAAAKKTTAKKAAAKKVAAAEAPAEAPVADTAASVEAEAEVASDASETLPLFQAPEPVKKPARRTRKTAAQKAAEAAALEAAEAEAAALAAAAEDDETVADEAVEAELQVAEDAAAAESTDEKAAESDDDSDADENGEGSEDGDESDEDGAPTRRRRRRGGRRRRKSSGQGEGQSEADGDAEGSEATSSESSEAEGESSESEGDSSGDDNDSAEGGSSSSRRRRRRRRAGDSDGSAADDPENTVVRVREARRAEDQITAVSGSTRLEAKKQRRREGREAGRRRAPIVSEAEFLARREAVDRTMVIRQRPDLTQIAVLEDKVLVEHYVARESQTSLIGNVYLGRVQNVLPSMEAAFVDIGKGRNAVLYAGEVNWSALGHKEGQPRKIEAFLSPGQQVLVQVTKDPIGHKGARLTSQVSLAGRFLVYVPDGTTSGISRKLPDTERARLKALLKEIVPDSAGVIVRTAAEGASEDELTADVERLKARWEDIEAKKGRGNGPTLLYGEPDLTLKVVRDLFTEDFAKLVVEGDDAWETVSGYVEHVAPDLAERLEKYEPKDAASAAQGDVFSVYRIDEQIAKGLDRKVWLPSGGSLIIDRTEAMTVVDVNTGKFTGSGGNLEETVTKNNLEAAEEIVRQLRLRDIGGIIVVDFIDMVLESNRDLVLRRLVECLGRDRTRHQVAEVTSLGLVQMTRKRIGTGLLEAFSTDCEACHGRGLVTHAHPVDPKSGNSDDDGRRGRRNRGKGSDKGSDKPAENNRQDKPTQEAAAPAQAEQEAPAAAGEGAEQNEPRARRRNRGRNRGERNQNETVESAASGEGSESAPEAAEAQAPVEKPVEKPAEQPAEVESVVEETVTEQPAVPAVEEPQEPAAPKVVTRTRTRRGASRPTTTAAVTPTPVAVEAVVPVVVAPPVPTPEESRPRVVTRTRGRAASRPADGASTAPEGSVESSQSEPAPEVEHVPVKKKGARKR